MTKDNNDLKKKFLSVLKIIERMQDTETKNFINRNNGVPIGVVMGAMHYFDMKEVHEVVSDMLQCFEIKLSKYCLTLPSPVDQTSETAFLRTCVLQKRKD
ncbi:MAG: hypothetical protein PHY88_00160 [Candidatus Omnitrophica bacterium]|nr:hypothetical protein [Candidatus Omnitrophota bacterium]